MSDEKLARAQEHCFMAGVDDAGAKLCEANVPFGLAKIHHVQESLGLPPDATFVGSPDATITRNNKRWSQGFGYGGVYEWSGDFYPLDIKPNACGMLVGALPRFHEPDELRESLHRFSESGLELDGVPLDNDLTESNHFVDVLTVDEEASSEAAPDQAKHFFIMHSSGHEHRENTERGPGLYYDQSDVLLKMARSVETPWGSLTILEGETASEWFAFYQKVQDFNHRRREAIAKALFGEFTPTVNATHQGMVRGLNRANIGCYTFDDPAPGDDAPLFPLTLSPDLPAFLVRGNRNVTDGGIEKLGWSDRITKHGLESRIAGTNLLPHGGGYNYAWLEGVEQVRQEGPDKRVFELRQVDRGAEAKEIETPRGLPYTYRGMEVKDRMESLDLGRAVVKLDLNYVLKA